MRHARGLLFVATLAQYGCADSESTGGGGGGPGPQPTPSPTAAPPPTARTWVSGDTHIHATGCAGSSSTSGLISRMQRGGVNVGAALIWGGRYDSDLPKFSGGDHRDSQIDPNAEPAEEPQQDQHRQGVGEQRGGGEPRAAEGNQK